MKNFIKCVLCRYFWISCWLLLPPVVLGQDFASTAPRQTGNESVRQSKSLKTALAEMEAVYKVSIMYKSDDVENISVPEVSREANASFESALDQLLQSSRLRFKKLKENLYLVVPKSPVEETKKVSGVNTPPVTVTGTVTETQNGDPLPGVNIIEKGTSNGTVSDEKGSYRLTVSGAEATLVFTYIGYVSTEVAVGTQSQIDVKLTADMQHLSEVVVTAFGVKREERALGYSVSQLSGDQVNSIKEANPVKALAGKVAGVNIRNTSPDPGSSVIVTIRGESSLAGNNQPLFVIDGVPVANGLNNLRQPVGRGVVDYGNPIADLNPDDIETVTVLKGASAAALYGTRAGNGVILITTKSGSKASKGLGVSINSTTMFDKAWQFPLFQNDFGAGDRPGTEETISTAAWGPRLNIGTQHAQWDSPLDADGEPVPTDWVAYPDRHRDFYETGRTLTNNISVTGNNDQGNFRLSFTNLDNRGIVPNTDLKRNTINLAAGYKVHSKVNVTTNLTYTNSKSNNRPTGNRGSVNEIVYTTTPNVDINKLRNYWLPGREELQQFSHVPGDVDNPFFVAYEHTNGFFRNRLTGNVQANIQITPHLSLMARTGTDLYNEERESKRPFGSVRNPTGAYSVENLFFNENNSDFLLTYQREVSSDWFFSVSAGGNRMDQRSRSAMQATESLSLPGIYNVSNATAGTVRNTQYNARKRINSLYGMGQIAFRNQIFLDLTGRNDWSSTLPAGNNSFFYPSASLSFIVSDIFKLTDITPISFAKLRANWAQVGKDTDPYALFNTYGFNQDWGTVKRATTDFNLKNQNLKPEIATSYEAGLDIRFLDGRVGLDATYYHTSNRNQILRIPTTMAAGYSSKLINAGEIQNQGWELSLNAKPLVGGFRWETAVNFTRNRNKVVKLTEGITEYLLNSAEGVNYLIKEGTQMGDIYARTWAKVPNGPQAGEPLLEENGSYQRLNEFVKIGNYNPDFLVGFSNTFTFKNFSLYALLDWRQGGEFFSYTAKNLLSDGRTTNTLFGRDTQTGGLAWTDEQGRNRTDGIITYGWVENADGTYRENTTIMEPEPYYGNYYWDYNERSTYDASFVKLREASLTYAFDAKLLGKLPISNLSVAVIARNLFSWTAADAGFDPETSMNIDANGGFRQGVGTWTLPNTRSYGFKVGFNF